jgi:hypothetical protein
VAAETATSPPAAPHPEAAAALPDGSEGAAAGWSLSALRGVWAKAGGATLRAADQSVPWPKWVALAFLLGAGAGIVRILVGLWGVRECRRRSERITDPALTGLLEDLRAEMRITRRAQARELAGLPAAATVGWLRPIILLPNDWREWSAEERRAVLAHELAHVRRGDYLAGLVARLGIALHFYHPLVYWLAARLHLQQELAADALGAGHSGGRGPYLKALARLALRQDRRPVGWPARTFLSSNGTLMRRVHMLRKDRCPQFGPRRVVRALAVAVLAAVAVGVSALRSPAQKAERPDPAAGERFYAGGFRTVRGFEFKAAAAEREPFDLSYLAADATGVVAVRPAAIFARPGMKKYADLLNKYLAMGSKDVGFCEGLTLPFDQLEQVSASAFIKPLYGTGPKKSGLMLGQPVLRTAKDYDWKGRFIDLLPGIEEVSYHGRVYYRVPKGKLPALAGLCTCFYLPDSRTLVCLSEKGIRQVIDHKKIDRPRFAWEDDWKQVEHGLFAVAVDNRDKDWLKDRQPNEDLNEAGLQVGRHLSSLVQGVDGGAAFTVTAIGRCESEDGARSVVRAAKELLRDAGKELEKAAKEKPDGARGRECRCGLELLRNAHLRRDGACVRWTSAVQLDLAELLGAAVAEGAARQHKKK